VEVDLLIRLLDVVDGVRARIGEQGAEVSGQEDENGDLETGGAE
jgi:hypothetical protein